MTFYKCSHCGSTYHVNETIFRCRCRSPLELIKSLQLNKKKIDRRDSTMWRYREAIPIKDDRAIVTLGEGMTPLVNVTFPGFACKAKVEFVNPTGSFKDRGASVLVSLLKEIGVGHVVEDSSGNAGSALAAYTAQAGVSCEIFCPEQTSAGKLVQIRFYGAQTNLIPGTRRETAEAVLKRADKEYYGSHNWNPFFIEGLKTIAYEIAEQTDWQAPDNVICPLGYGGLLLGLHLGFKELLGWKMIDKMPRLFGVQTQACAPIFDAYRAGRPDVAPGRQRLQTLAEGICAEKPPRGRQVISALREAGGAVTTVTEEEIKEGTALLAARGFFVEPTSAVVVKGMEHILKENLIRVTDKTVMVLTGSGLKTISEIQEHFLS